jgi:hypothetical protein
VLPAGKLVLLAKVTDSIVPAFCTSSEDMGGTTLSITSVEELQLITDVPAFVKTHITISICFPPTLKLNNIVYMN